MSRSQAHSKHDELITALSDREIEVLSLFDQGLSYNEGARRLLVWPNTIKKHAVNTYEKLGVHGKRDAIAKAMEEIQP